MIQQRPKPAQAGGAAPVPQHSGPHVRIGGVDRDVERTEAFLHDPRQIEFGEPRERGEVAVQE